jgi:starch synthase
MLNILIAATEAVPFAKSGGLADVVGALPKALIKNGVDARVIMPKYKIIPEKFKSNITLRKKIMVRVGWREQYCGIEECVFEGVTYYFIDNEYYFGRERLYSFGDEAEMFTFFSRAVLETLPHIDFVPNIIHCNDWQTGMIPVFLEINYKQFEYYKNINTMFTIHNLQYQGIFPFNIMTDVLCLETKYFTSDKLEYYGNVNFLKGGIVYSKLITTVSPTYAREIQNSYFGEGLHELLQARSNDLFGILNGVDYEIYNPETDKSIFKNYTKSSLYNKNENKVMLQRELGLQENIEIPMIGIISRLVAQKGFDLITWIIEELLKEEIQIVILGTGDDDYEEFFKKLATKYPDKVSVNIKFSQELSHKIYAGSDLFLMPSRFEPCGLSQIISMKYGTVPIVRETGGLEDTVKSYNQYSEKGNGFSFANYNAHEMLFTIKKALEYYKNKPIWEKITASGMECDYSWDNSSQKYIELYKKICYHL